MPSVSLQKLHYLLCAPGLYIPTSEITNPKHTSFFLDHSLPTHLLPDLSSFDTGETGMNTVIQSVAKIDQCYGILLSLPCHLFLNILVAL